MRHDVNLEAREFYAEAYRTGFVPWEVAGEAGLADEQAFFDREEAAHPAEHRRALDIGCGRGRHSALLAERGWEVTGVDFVPEAIEAAGARPDAANIRFVVGDAADLTSVTSGSFDFFLDGGCFHGLSPNERSGWGRGIEALSAPGATMLMVAFDPWSSTPIPPNVPAGTTLDGILAVLPGWKLLSDDPLPDTYRPVPQPAHYYRLGRS
ncbi:class I SAM-dependent methyltransferase [Propionicimonas sp.]|uniref:class I SAM-dependent methyltransferase n=1 Tax=Propionicimonas sp. TaxID=1955623 RepID=UPI0039E35B09